MRGPSLSAEQEGSGYRLSADVLLRRSAWMLATGLLAATIVSGNARWTGRIRAADDPKGATLKAIIENVRTNEALYQNIDVSWLVNYSLERASEQPTKSLLRSSTTRGHLVQQQALFFVGATRESDGNDGSRDKTRSSQEAFDGASTRILRDDAVGNVIEGRHESTLTIRPHTLILRNSFIRVPLSTYLEGAEACRGNPLGWSFRDDWKDLTSTTEFLGSEQVGSRPCVHLRITTRLNRNGKVHVHGRHDLWLAVDRNYIPLKKINFAWRDPMGDLIGQVDEVTDFREIAPESGIRPNPSRRVPMTSLWPKKRKESPAGGKFARSLMSN